ncbi:hypothetical protein D3C87_75780 [compost metagenome]
MTNYIKALESDGPVVFRDQAQRLIQQFDTDATVIDGVVRWNSNNQVPPKDILELWDYIGKDFDIDKSLHVCHVETTEFLSRYRESQKNREYSDEEMGEMRAAFGSDTTVVNVVTGRRIQL